MSRRSDRLMMSGYYRTEQEDGDRSVTYQETPIGRVFKKRPRKRRLSSSRTSSSRSSFADADLAEIQEFLKPSLFYPFTYTPASTSTDIYKAFHSLDTPDQTSSSFSGRSSGLENSGRVSGFVLLILTAVMTIGLTLGFGFWFYSSSSSKTFRSTKTLQDSPFTAAKIAEMTMLRDEVFSRVTESESKWKDVWTREWNGAQKQIALLKEDRERQNNVIEDLKTELNDLKATMRTKDLFEKKISAAKKQISEMKAHLSSWVKRVGSLMSGSQGAAVQQAELQAALKDLETRLTDYCNAENAQEREELLKSVKKTMGTLTMQDVDDRVQEALHLLKSDGVGMPDFALESLGSTIIESRCSKSFPAKPAVFSMFGIPLFQQTPSPRTIIQPEVSLGKCWAFKGEEGYATVALAYPVYITHVTLEHLPKELSPTGYISSAPKEFSVYGMMSETEEEGKLLGTFLYDHDGEPVQTFELLESVRDVFSVVELRVRSNWGHPHFTCVYRFRVHGKLWIH